MGLPFLDWCSGEAALRGMEFLNECASALKMEEERARTGERSFQEFIKPYSIAGLMSE